jgi:hypothetical protein
MKNTMLTAAMTLVMLSSQCLPAFAMGPQLVTGTEASSRVHELTRDINWTHSLSAAESQARKEGKMIFWVQMLGDIAGGT